MKCFPIEDLMLADEEQSGFCRACGEEQDRVEPDAENYKCDHCGETEVYGAQQLILLGAFE